MTDYDRGAYTPQSDAPLAFDARQSRGGGGGGGPSSMTLIVSGVLLLLLVIALLLFYRTGVRRADEAPRVIGAPMAQTKSPPPASAQPPEPAAGLQVYKTEVAPASEGRAPNFVPAPEQPAKRPAPAVQAETPTITSLEPPPEAESQAPKARLRATQTAPAQTAAAAQAVSPPTKADKPAKAVAVNAAASDSAGGAIVQIGAFSSAALADKGWNDTANLLPGAMAGKTKKVEFITKDDKPFYRTFVGGFASKIEARTFCAALKAAGKTCFVK